LWTDGYTYVCMDGRTDGHLRPALLGRLCRRVDLKIIQINGINKTKVFNGMMMTDTQRKLNIALVVTQGGLVFWIQTYKKRDFS